MNASARPRRHQVTISARFPDFFVVGHPKCGTTALYDMLCQHPQIYMSPIKEPRFFVADDELRFPLMRQTTEEKYLSLFDGAEPGQITGEASPQYLGSVSAARAIAGANSGARIIAILRDPVSFIRSLHYHYVRRGIDRPGDLGSAFAAGAQHPLWRYYRDRVRYVDQLERYHAVFPNDQILVLVYDDYRWSNLETIRRVFRFLDIDDELDVAPRELNAAAGVRSHVAAAAWQRLMMGQDRLSAALGRAARSTIPHRARDAVRGLYRRANLIPPAPVDEELMAQLRLQLAAEVRRTSDYLGRDLARLWGYPDA
jgi:Sulfotransferase domain